MWFAKEDVDEVLEGKRVSDNASDIKLFHVTLQELLNHFLSPLSPKISNETFLNTHGQAHPNGFELLNETVQIFNAIYGKFLMYLII